MYKDFVSCLRPKKIRNSNGQWLTVGCGTCKACLQRMANKSAYLCSLNELDYKYTMFVTLTYSNDNIPLLSCVDNGGDSYHEFVFSDCTPRFANKPKVYGNVMSTVYVTPFYYAEIQRKFYYFGDKTPYLSKYDAQCFMKRFRKHLKKYSNEKVSFYLVGEYGPVHFRPHFHILFSFNDPKILEVFGQVLHKSWTLGFVDYSMSRGNCNSYVAKYVNSRNSVPRLYCDRSVRPFCLHSQNFAQSFYKSAKKKIYETSDFKFSQLVRSCHGNNQVTYAWRSLVSCFFPKCRKFSLLNATELAYTYTILRHAQSFYRSVTTSIPELVDLICGDLFMYSWNDKKFAYTKLTGSKDYFLYMVNSLITRFDSSYFIETDNCVFRYCDLNDVLWNSVKQSIASLLYLSNHFIEFCCDGDLSLVSTRLRQIVMFYQSRDYDNLVSQYQLQEDVLNDSVDDSDISFLYYLYDNVFPKTGDADISYFVLSNYEVHLYFALSHLPIFDAFVQKVNENWHKSVKHKYLNDLNEIFC